MRKQIESLIPEKIETLINENMKANLALKAFSITKIPMLFLTGAKVLEITDQKSVVQIPFMKLVKNHLGSLYFGALAIGADACVGLLAVDKINKSGEKVDFVFKSFSAQFLKRPIGPTNFICEDGEKISELVNEVIQTGERAHKSLRAYAETGGEIVAEFSIELSLKQKS